MYLICHWLVIDWRFVSSKFLCWNGYSNGVGGNWAKLRFKSEISTSSLFWMLGPGHSFESYESFRRYWLAGGSKPLQVKSTEFWLAFSSVCPATTQTALSLHSFGVSPPCVSYHDALFLLAVVRDMVTEALTVATTKTNSQEWDCHPWWSSSPLSVVWWHKTMKHCLSAAWKGENLPLLPPELVLQTFGTVGEKFLLQ